MNIYELNSAGKINDRMRNLVYLDSIYKCNFDNYLKINIFGVLENTF